MDVNELIDNLRMPSWHDLEDPDATLLADAADALSTLQAGNEKLRADVVRLNDLLASYQNVLVPELRAELERVKRERDSIKETGLEPEEIVGLKGRMEGLEK